jgi:glycerate kinase
VTRLRVLFAPDSFKGTLSSVEAARALAEGWASRRPHDLLDLVPLADGGDGTIEAVAASGPPGLRRHRVQVTDPIGRPITAEFLTLGDGFTAVIELAAASGLARLRPEEHDPLRASTDGTGSLLVAALALGVRRIILGLGGSATTDGGSGMLRALGARLRDDTGAQLPPGGAALARAAALHLDGLPGRLAEVRLVAATDVRNPLLGPHGAAAVYGPQKGASPAEVAVLDAGLSRWASLLEAIAGRPIRDVPGTGAAGGTLAALLAIRDSLAGLVVRPGVEVVMELAGFGERLAGSDLVVTGEGRLDAQTAFGKTVWGVATRARRAGVRCAAVVGTIGEGGREALAGLVDVVVSTSGGTARLDELMAQGAIPLREAAARLATTMEPS